MVTIYCLALYSESDSETNTKPLCHIQTDRLVLETELGKRGSEGQTDTETHLQRAAVSLFMLALKEHHQGMQNLRVGYDVQSLSTQIPEEGFAYSLISAQGRLCQLSWV